MEEMFRKPYFQSLKRESQCDILMACIRELIKEFNDFKELLENEEKLFEYKNLVYHYYEKKSETDLPIYYHFSKPKGLAIIINEFKWMPDRNEDRKGSDKDAKKLEELLKIMNFEIYQGRNVDLKKRKILRRLKAFASDKRHMEYNSCIVVIMGHGDDGVICDIHGKEIYINYEILNLFNGNNAPNLVGKPKFFIFQSCRGEYSDDGALSSHQQEVSGGQSQSSSVKYKLKSDFNKISNLPSKKSPAHDPQKVSIYSDFFAFYATVPTMPAYRDELVGSAFIDSINKVFYKFAHICDLVDMATKIQGRVASQQFKEINEQTGKEEIKFQQPQLTITNSKKYFMFPGVYID